MLEKGKISCNQTIWLLICLVGATALLFLPSLTASVSGRDSWMTAIVATLTGFYLVMVITMLGNIYPGQNLFQYLKSILGTWAGGALGFLYIFFLVHTNSVVIREFGHLMNTIVLQNTPEVVLSVILVLLSAWSVRGGLEVLARAVEFFLPVVIVLFLITLVLTAPDMKLDNLFPVLENGFMPVIHASFNPIAWRGEVIVLAIILPFLARPSSGGKCGYIAVTGIGLLLVLDALTHTAVFGPMVETMTFSSFSLARQIQIGGFFERIDAVIVMIWVMGMYGKISLFYYVIVLGTAQVTGIKDYRPLVLPMGVLLLAVSYRVADSASGIIEYISGSFPYFAFVFEYLVPTLLLLIAVLKKKQKQVVDS